MPASKQDFVEAGAKLVAVVALPILAKFATRQRRVTLQPENQAWGSNETIPVQILPPVLTATHFESGAEARKRTERIADIIERARKSLYSQEVNSVWDEMNEDGLDKKQFAGVTNARSVRDILLKATTNRSSVLACEDEDSERHSIQQIFITIQNYNELETLKDLYITMRNVEHQKLRNWVKNPETATGEIMKSFRGRWGSDATVIEIDDQPFNSFKDLIASVDRHLQDIKILNGACEALENFENEIKEPPQEFKSMRARGFTQKTTTLSKYTKFWRAKYDMFNKEKREALRVGERTRVKNAAIAYNATTSSTIEELNKAELDTLQSIVGTFSQYDQGFRTTERELQKETKLKVQQLFKAHNILRSWSPDPVDIRVLREQYNDLNIIRLPNIRKFYEGVVRTYTTKITESKGMEEKLKYFALAPYVHRDFLAHFPNAAAENEKFHKKEFYIHVKNKLLKCQLLHAMQSQENFAEFEQLQTQINRIPDLLGGGELTFKRAVLEAAFRIYNIETKKIEEDAIKAIDEAFNANKSDDEIASIANIFNQELSKKFEWLSAPSEYTWIQRKTVDYSNKSLARIHAKNQELNKRVEMLMQTPWTDAIYNEAKQIATTLDGDGDGDLQMNGNGGNVLTETVRRYETLKGCTDANSDIYSQYTSIRNFASQTALQIVSKHVRDANKPRVDKYLEDEKKTQLSTFRIELRAIPLDFEERQWGIPNYIDHTNDLIERVKGSITTHQGTMASIYDKYDRPLDEEIFKEVAIEWGKKCYYPAQEKFLTSYVDRQKSELLKKAQKVKNQSRYSSWQVENKNRLANYNTDDAKAHKLDCENNKDHKRIAESLRNKFRALSQQIQFPKQVLKKYPNVKQKHDNVGQEQQNKRVGETGRLRQQARQKARAEKRGT